MTNNVQLPATWISKRLKYVASHNDEVLPEDTDDLKEIDYVEISGVSLYGGIEEINRMTFFEAPSRARRKVRSGDILVSTVRTYLKAIATVDDASDNLIASTGFCVVRSRGEADTSFLGWVAKSEPFVSEVVARSVGVSYPAINASELVDIDVPLPPFDVQKRISAFLDKKTERIDALISGKRTLLQRLAEKRQAIITQAVTRGLDPGVPMKDSGIEWLGQIPAHWNTMRLKYISPRISVGIVITPAAYYSDEGTLALRGLNIRAMGVDLSDVRYLSAEGHQINRKSVLSEGDLVAVRTGAPGTTTIIPQELHGCNCIDLVIVRRPEHDDPRYLGWFLNSDVAKVQYAMGSEGALQQHFNIETASEVIVSRPPVQEQRNIRSFIESTLKAHDRQEAAIRDSVTKLNEYRSALITAAITGQIEGLQ